MKRTILAVGAHHDDIEFRAGGTVAKYVQDGWNFVYSVVCTTPHYNLPRGRAEKGEYPSNNEVISMRKREASEGARILGASSVHFLDYRSIYWYREGTKDRVYLDGINCNSADLEFLEKNIPGREFIVSANRVESAIEFMAGFISSHGADIVLTHSADDRHWEHYATAGLVLKAVESLRKDKDIRLYGWRFGSTGTLNYGFRPRRFVDISETIDVKCRALRVFKSQAPGNDPEIFAARERLAAREYGKLCGFDYAEPFLDFHFGEKEERSAMIVPGDYEPPKEIEGLD